MALIKRLLKLKDSALFVAILLLLSKILGFLVTRTIAGMFGASRELDIFWASFVMPDTLFNILVAGSVSAALIPVFSDVLHRHGNGKLVKLFSITTVALSITFIAIASVIFIWAPEIIQLLSDNGVLGNIVKVDGGVNPGDMDLLVQLTRIMMISPLLMSISAVITSFLQVHKRFFITTIAPFLYNFGRLVGTLLFAGKLGMGVKGLGYAVVLGAFLHIAVQLPILYKFIRDYLKISSWKELNGQVSFYLKEVRKIVKLATPRALGMAGEQLNVVVNTVRSFSLTSGALSAFKFATSLYLLPVNVIGTAISSVTLPNLSELHAKGDDVGFAKAFNKSLRSLLFLILPAAGTLMVLRLPIVRLAYGTGSFDWWDTVVTSWCLALLGGAILGQTVAQLAARAQFATHDSKWPLIATLLGVAVNLTVSHYFTNFFSHYLDWRPMFNQVFVQVGEGVREGGMVDVFSSFIGDLGIWFTTRREYDAAVGGLALSLTTAALTEMFFNLVFLQRKVKVMSKEGTWIPLLKMSLSTAASMFAMYVTYRYLDGVLDTEYVINVIFTLVGSLFTGGVAYVVMGMLFKVEELEDLLDYILKVIPFKR